MKEPFLMVCLFAGIASEAGTPVTTRNALALELYGTIDVGGVYRNEAFHNLYFGPYHKASPQEVHRFDGATAEGRRVAPSIFQETGSLFVIDPQLSLGLKATMQKNVVALVELATPFYVIGEEGGASAFRSEELFSSSVSSLYSGSQAEHRRYIEVEQAYVELRNLIAQDSGLNLRLGITDYAHDFRGNGHPFLIDVQNSENPFLSPTGAQPYLIINTRTGNPAWDVDSANPDDYRRIAGSLNGRNSQDAAGALARYATEGGIVKVDAYIFDIFESYERNRDDWIIGSTVTLGFDENSETGKISPTALLLLNDSSAVMATLGTGIQYFPLPQKVLELYTEGYAQFGHYAKGVTVDQGPVGTGGRWAPSQTYDTITQRGAYAFYAGARIQAPEVKPEEEGTVDMFGGWRPYLDVSYWDISGDDEANDHHNEAFVSLENNNLSLIVESSYWGLDIDTNYRAIRVQAGFYPLKGLHVAAAYANFHLQNNNGSADARAGGRRYKIGDELDLTMTYEYSTNVKFMVGTGFLWDARALGTTSGVNLTMAQMVVDF